MWMKLAQAVLFVAGLFLPFALLPHPLPPSIDKGQLGIGAIACGIALAWLGTVGISHLLSAARGAGDRRGGSSAERIARRP
mgnify:CR=1 FL=1